MSSGYLCLNKLIKEVEYPELETISYNCFHCNEMMLSFKADKVKEINFNFLYKNLMLQKLELPSAEVIEDGLLFSNKILEDFTAPKLRIIGGGFLYMNEKIKSLSFKFLKEITEKNILKHNKVIEIFDVPLLSLEEVPRHLRKLVRKTNSTKKIEILKSLKSFLEKYAFQEKTKKIR